MPIPLVILALLFAVLATVEWERLPLIARVYLGVGTAFAVGWVVHPGLTVAEALAQPRDGIALLLDAARMAGFAAFMVSAASALRRLAPR
jgi:ACR3 family arsenite efflux pump ArsB